MRLLALHLERYGPFTGRSIAFRSDARLHVVLGPNEAGKSSALAAVTDLFFGIEPRTRYAFLHEMPELRIGAEIADRDGRRLAFRRRKGNRNTLVDAQDAPLPDDALAPFLSGLTREVFCRAFGLDARGLREGGREMLDIGGEVGASLFAAGSGLRGFTALQKTLDEESQRIFAPRRAQGRSFYQALDRYDAASRRIRETALREGAWRELNDEIAAAAARLDEIKATRDRMAAERARLERLKRVGPLIAGIDDTLARAEADEGLVEAGDAWIDRLGTLLDGLRAAEAEHARLDAALAAARADLDAVPEEAELTRRAEEILECFRGIDRYDKDGIDLPRVQVEALRLADDLARLAVRVGLPDVAALAQAQPSDAARARIEGLIREGQGLATTLDRIGRELAAARAEHEGLARDEAEGGRPIDPAPLREALKPLQSLHGAFADRDNLQATIRRNELALRGLAARMSPPVAVVSELAAAALPSAETVAHFRSRLDESERVLALARQRHAAATATIAAARRRMREREAGRPIASHDDLLRLRAERDRSFAVLREALATGAQAAPISVAGFERALHAADSLADDLAHDAARVAEQAADLKRLESDEAEAAAAAKAVFEAQAAIGDGFAAWAEAWRGMGIAARSPAEMAAWLMEAEGLIERHDALEELRVDVGLLSERIAAARAPLAALGQRVGLDDLDGLDPRLVLERVEERVAALGRRWDATREAGARIRAAAAGIARLEASLCEAKARHEAWRAAWGAALPAIGLSPEAGIEEASSALAAWQEVPATLRERDTAERRVSGLHRDREAYRARVAGLVAQAPDLDAASPSAAIRTLHGRLQAAQAREARRTELTRRRDEAERRAGAALRALDEAVAALSRHLAELQADREACARSETEALHARLCARRAIRTELAARRAELVRAADGLPEPALRADLAATSADAIEAELARLAAEQEENERQGQVVFADRDRLERRRIELEGGTGAELAAAEKKAAEAELGASARQWAVLKLAQLMIGAAVARHRSGQQDPMLVRAGELFRALTGGGFSGLTQDYGESDEPHLVGRRASGAIVPVEGMSEGTRDQLYLALRLAYLQDYAASRETAPFFGDDLFLTFDDARTAYGLEALAAVGESIQPILFTHHGHVAELARARLAETVDIVQL